MERTRVSHRRLLVVRAYNPPLNTSLEVCSAGRRHIPAMIVSLHRFYRRVPALYLGNIF
jgi:hypothetical protein